MALLNRITIAIAALSVLSTARPLAVRDAVMVTETEYKIVDVPVTLWVDEDGKPIATVAQGGNFAGLPTSVPATSSADSNKVIQSAFTSSSSSSSTTVAVIVPTTTPAPQIYTTPAPTYQAAATTPAPVVAQVVTTSQHAAATPSQTAAASSAPQSNGSSGQTGAVTGSASATCEGTGNACSGDITHYDGGLGACGWDVNTASDLAIALPVGFMGAQSNGNPYCGRSVTVQNPTTGKTVQAKIGDKCMGCVDRAIDLTDALFAAVGGGCDGRCPGFVWWLN